MSEQPKIVKIKRLQIGVNVLVQILTVALIVWMANFIAFNHFKRWDFSREQKYALSDQTKRVLKSLRKPVKVIVFFSGDSPVFGDVDALLKEYQYGSRKKIEVETINPYRNLTRAKEVVTKYKLGPNENVLVLDSDGHSKVVNATDMADYDTGEAMYGQPPRLTAFKGEQAVTSALLEVSEAKQNKIYVLNGHGEPELKSESLSGLKAYIERQNLKLEALNLMDVDKLPEDAKAIVILGAKYDFTEREMKLVQDYWAKNGRLFIALDPAAATTRLIAFLAAQGIKPDDDRILRTVNLGPVTGVLRDVTTNFVEGSPITKRLKGVDGIFMGATQSLALDSGRAQPLNIKLQPLIQAGQGFWGETNYNVGEGDTIFFDSQKDRPAPLTIAASVEKGALKDERVKVDSARMIVVANATFVANEALTEANVDFMLGSLNWLIDREELIGITPKEAKTFTLNLTQAQVSNIALLSMAVIPALAAALGMAMWWQRRR